MVKKNLNKIMLFKNKIIVGLGYEYIELLGKKCIQSYFVLEKNGLYEFEKKETIFNIEAEVLANQLEDLCGYKPLKYFTRENKKNFETNRLDNNFNQEMTTTSSDLLSKKDITVGMGYDSCSLNGYVRVCLVIVRNSKYYFIPERLVRMSDIPVSYDYKPITYWMNKNKEPNEKSMDKDKAIQKKKTY